MSDRPDEPRTPQAGETPAPEVQAPRAPISAETASLLGLIDKLGVLLERTDLVELEVESGDTGIVLRKHSALSAPAVMVAGPAAGAEPPAAAPVEAAPVSSSKFIKAPLTGIYYAASSPSSPPYVTPGQHIVVGQVIGLIEAMKLFNEIKADQAGRVVRVVAETGKLVKAKQPLIEVEP